MADKCGPLVCVTGASGAIYAKTLFKKLGEADYRYGILYTKTAKRIAEDEANGDIVWITGPNPPDFMKSEEDGFVVDTLSSSSFTYTSVIVIPCSAGFLSRVASGISSNSLERSVDVAIKEKIPVVMVLRETPLSPIHLENALKLSRLGVVILPACPSFYNHEKTFNSLVESVVYKALTYTNIPEFQMRQRWYSGT